MNTQLSNDVKDLILAYPSLLTYIYELETQKQKLIKEIQHQKDLMIKTITRDGPNILLLIRQLFIEGMENKGLGSEEILPIIYELIQETKKRNTNASKVD